MKLWSTMRTFLDFSTADTPEWAAKLWVFAAFDETAIDRLWKAPDGESMADTFLQKTFQIRFKIPAPLLSDWRDFLKVHLTKAIPDCTEDDFYRVTRIYAILRAEKKSPTPRDIKVFVNQIGSLWRTAPEVIALSHLALYVAASSSDWSPIDGKPLPEQHRLESYLAPGWLEDLTALYYNMPRDKAMQVQLNQTVETALTEAKPETIQKLAKLAGIDAVIEKVLEERLPNWRKSEPRAIGRAAYALAPMFELPGDAGARMLNRLQTAAQQVQAWDRIDKSAGLGLARLIRLKADTAFSKDVLRGLTNSNPAPDATSPTYLDEIKTWAEGVFSVLRGVLLLDQEKTIQDEFRFGASANDYLLRLTVIQSLHENKDLWPHLKPGSQPGTVIEHISQTLVSGPLSLTLEITIEVMVCVQIKWDWQPVVQAIQGRLAGLQCPPDETERLLGALLRLERLALAPNALQTFTASGALFHYLNSAQNTNAVGARAKCLLIAFLFDPEGNAAANQQQARQGKNVYNQFAGNPTSNPQVFDAVYSLALELGYVQNLLASRNSIQLCRPFVDAILRKAAAIEDAALPFTSSEFVDNYQAIRSAINNDAAFEKAVRSMVDRGGLIPEMGQRAISPENVDLYRTVLTVKADPSLGTVVVSSLQRASKEDWLTDFDGSCALAALTQQIAKMGVRPELAQNLQDALRGLGESVLEKQIPKQVQQETCEELVGVLVSAQQEILKRHLRDLVVKSDASVSNLLQLFGRTLMDCSILVEEADDLVRLAFPKMLDRRDETELVWLKTIIALCPDLLVKCRPASSDDFKRRVRSLIAQPLDDKTAGLISAIAVVLRIEAEEPKQD